MILGGLDEFTGSYETLTGWLGIVPQGAAAALAVTAVGPARLGDLLQHGAGGGLPARAALVARRRSAGGAPPGGTGRPTRPARGRFDPRAVVLAALLATALLLASTAWLLLLGVLAWLVPAWLLSRPDHDAVPLGLVLAGMLAFAALTGGLLGGAGLELTLQRVRARGAARRRRHVDARRGRLRAGCARRSGGRCIGCARCRPCREAAALMAGLDAGPRLVAAGRAAVDRFSDVALRPAELCDALTGWVAAEAAGYRPGDAPARIRLRLRAPDGLLLVLTLTPALALLPT